MIALTAQVSCDRWGCEAKGEVTLELKVSKEHNIPKLEEQGLPEGWSYKGLYQDGEHYCPDHKEK